MVGVETKIFTIVSDKDSHFTGAIAQNAKENENITYLEQNKIKILTISIQADENLNFRLLFWSKDTFDDTDLDDDVFIGAVDVDLSSNGFQIGGAGQYYMDVRDVNLEYEDEDESRELHVSLMNLSAASKTAGANGEVKIKITYTPRL